MAMLPGDYKRRIQSTNRSAGVNSGYAVSPVHVPGGSTNFQVAAAGDVITLTSVNVTASTGLYMFFKDSAGTIENIIEGALTARDYKQNFYCPWPVYVSVDTDTTVYVAAISTGATED